MRGWSGGEEAIAAARGQRCSAVVVVWAGVEGLREDGGGWRRASGRRGSVVFGGGDMRL